MEIRGWTGRGHLQSETAFHRDSSGQVSLLFPGNVSIKCCLRLREIRGWTGRGHLQSETAFHRDSSGQISLLFPGNVFIKCCLRLRQIRGWTGRGHLQSETAFHRDSSGQISLLFPGNVSICLRLNNFDVLCILNTFEQFRYVMNCFYLCIQVCSLFNLLYMILHQDVLDVFWHRYGIVGFGIWHQACTYFFSIFSIFILIPCARLVAFGSPLRGRHNGVLQRGDTTGKLCKMSNVTFIAGKQKRLL